MRKTDINYSIIRAKRNGCGCPAHHSSLFSLLQGGQSRNRPLIGQGGQSRNRPLIGHSCKETFAVAGKACS